MTNNLGMGVMINMLGGNEETVNTLNEVIGQTITDIKLNDNTLELTFEGTKIGIFDDGQSCCENRYMDTDDNLSEFVGAKLLDLEKKYAGTQDDDDDGWGDVTEIQFLDVKTDKGTFQMKNYNEHNGYYGGFWIVANKI